MGVPTILVMWLRWDEQTLVPPGLLVSDKKIFKVMPIRVYVKEFDLSIKKGQGQPKVNILSNFIGPMSAMLHTKPKGHWPFGFGEDFKGFLLYMGMVAILVMWPRCSEQTFVLPTHWGFIWNLVLIGSVFSEEKMFEECGQLWTDRWQNNDESRTTGSGYTKSSHMSLKSCDLTSDAWSRAIFDPRAIIWTILVEIYKKLHTKYQRPGPSGFRLEFFLKFCL